MYVYIHICFTLADAIHRQDAPFMLKLREKMGAIRCHRGWEPARDHPWCVVVLLELPGLVKIQKTLGLMGFNGILWWFNGGLMGSNEI